jgi:hypothetical protein
LQEQGRQFDTTALFQAIQGLFGQGERNIDPFRQFAALGIMPEEIIVSPSAATQVITGLTGLVDAGGGLLANIGGGGSDPFGNPPLSPGPISGGPSSFPPGTTL